jgi:hypothetical protein
MPKRTVTPQPPSAPSLLAWRLQVQLQRTVPIAGQTKQLQRARSANKMGAPQEVSA